MLTAWVSRKNLIITSRLKRCRTEKEHLVVFQYIVSLPFFFFNFIRLRMGPQHTVMYIDKERKLHLLLSLYFCLFPKCTDKKTQGDLSEIHR